MLKTNIIGPLSICVALAIFILCHQAFGVTSPRLGKGSITEVIAAMTLEEKAALVVGTGMDIPPDKADTGEAPATPVVGDTTKLVPGSAGTTYSVPRLGITAMVLADGPAGLRISPTRENDTNTYYGTAFPIATLLASTWDTDLVYRVGQSMGNEVLEYGVDIILGPGMNLHRDPLCGRNFEYFSEDPLVTGKIASAMVNGIQSRGVGACIKHFAANNQETNRNYVNTIVSERALRELYLESFRIAVEEAQPWAVMSSYNRINGIFAAENHDLLTKVLRQDWGFKGLVMTDWGGGTNSAARMRAGNDLIMPGNINQSEAIVKAVRDGTLDEHLLDRNVANILSVILQSPRYKRYAFSDKPGLKAHAAVTRQAATDGMVLLKNSRTALPLGKDIKTIAAFGNTSYQVITGGTGSGDVNEAYSVSLIEGLENRGYSIDEGLQALYGNYLKEAKSKQPKRTGLDAMMNPVPPIPEMEIDAGMVKNMADTSDIALITIGRNSGEGGDRKAEAGDFYLTDIEKMVLQIVSQAFQAKGKKTIVILNIGGVIETASWRGLPDAILLAWQGGQETGNSIADVISGKATPSGKLASTFPISYDDVPSFGNFPGIELPRSEGDVPPADDTIASLSFMKRIPSEVVYEEGIYVGYRYYNTFNVPVAYEFGYGLSYTQFEYSRLRLSSQEFNETMAVSIDVKNTGKTTGKEIVQVYLGAPGKKLDKPEKELKAFGKTGLLKPGETETLSFVLDKRSLASFETETSTWVAEAGEYEVKVGASSTDIRQKTVFALKNALLVKKETKALAPERSINELKQSFTVVVDSGNNGTVRVDPPPPEDGKYTKGTVITVIAVPDAGYVLDSCYYSAPGMFGPMFYESMASPFEVTVDQEKHVGASFIERTAVDHLNVIQNVVYAKPGVKTLKYDVFTPKGAKSLPVIVIIHGGGWAANTEDIMRGMARELTQDGKYVVCGIDYRWREKLDGDAVDNTIADLIGDVYGAIAHIMEHAAEYGGDPTKIALTGDSAGGHLSAAAANMSDKIGMGGFGKTPGVFEFMPSYMPKGKTVVQVRSEMMAAIRAVAPSYGVFSAELLKKFAGGPDDDDSLAEAIAPESHIPDVKERAIPHYLTRGSEDPLITDGAVKSYLDTLKKAGQRVEYVQVVGASHAFFDWKPDAQTKATFAKYGIHYCREMEAFFDSVFYTNN